MLFFWCYSSGVLLFGTPIWDLISLRIHTYILRVPNAISILILFQIVAEASSNLSFFGSSHGP